MEDMIINQDTQSYFKEEDNKYYFPRFKCTYDSCCRQNVYWAVYENGERETLELFEEAKYDAKLSVVSTPMYFKVPSKEVVNHMFYIYAKNTLG